MAEGTTKRKPYMYLCGTPKQYCSGAQSPLNAGMRGASSGKTHLSPEGAFSCHKKYLVVVLGFTPGDDTRSLFPPADGSQGTEVRILTKATRFGARLRNGKEGTRNMPHVRGHHAGSRGGCIVSS